jgi:hypothetical protein
MDIFDRENGWVVPCEKTMPITRMQIFVDSRSPRITRAWIEVGSRTELVQVLWNGAVAKVRRLEFAIYDVMNVQTLFPDGLKSDFIVVHLSNPHKYKLRIHRGGREDRKRLSINRIALMTDGISNFYRSLYDEFFVLCYVPSFVWQKELSWQWPIAFRQEAHSILVAIRKRRAPRDVAMLLIRALSILH